MFRSTERTKNTDFLSSFKNGNICYNSYHDGRDDKAYSNKSDKYIRDSMFMTFIAGLIPSRIAAKKDPVVALRTE